MDSVLVWSPEYFNVEYGIVWDTVVGMKWVIRYVHFIMESPEIPFCGGSAISPGDIASWVKPADKVPLVLAISLYGTIIPQLENYILVPGTYRVRVAAWIDNASGICIIGCRGTSIGKTGGLSDLKDDKVGLIFY